MNPQTALDDIHLPEHLAILSLSTPFFNRPTDNANNRSSNASSTEDSHDNATPAILAADLKHYQELFSKLRFSYVEQVTKERFLRAITADQPEFVDPSENAELEERLKEEKAALKERKQEVREMVKELEEQGRLLATRYDNIQLQTAQVETLPQEIANLESTISTLRATSAPKPSNPNLSLPLQPTLSLLAEKETHLADLDRQIAILQATLPQKQMEVSALQDEVGVLHTRKMKAVQEAQEARRRREGGAVGGDELEERGRWLRGVETGLRTMLEA